MHEYYKCVCVFLQFSDFHQMHTLCIRPKHFSRFYHKFKIEYFFCDNYIQFCNIRHKSSKHIATILMFTYKLTIFTKFKAKQS